ncbi:MAG TPA: FkbM family methyltransferase [Bacteriovoracaceae bacterium]|nr:FkbM family methyltransferase [Bacteriovoracaceae bacterium]
MHKPEYFYRPTQLLNRLGQFLSPPAPGLRDIPLVWGSTIKANPSQTIGRSLYSFGLYDLALSEMIYRLVRPGDVVLDIGANIGYTSRLILDCLGEKGNLFSYEPVPELFSLLQQNVPDGPVMKAFNFALSSQTGEATLNLPDSFQDNEGIASLEKRDDGKQITIQTKTLDSLMSDKKVRLMKIDVEGHELSVLKGAENCFTRQIFENILFEDLQGAGGETSKFLESMGYRIYKVVKAFQGLRLESPEYKQRHTFEPDNFLATKDTSLAAQINNRVEWQLYSWKRK